MFAIPQGGGGGGSGGSGSDGAPGSVWRSGSGAPSDSLGINGDYYLDTVTGDVYYKSGGTYTVVTNITGPPGEDGEDGSDGAPGSVWYTGSGPPTETPIVGHWTLGAAPVQSAFTASVNTISATINGILEGSTLVVGIQLVDTGSITITNVTCTSESNLTLLGTLQTGPNSGKQQLAILENVTIAGNKTLTLNLSGIPSHGVSIFVCEFIPHAPGTGHAGALQVASPTSTTPSVSVTTTHANEMLLGVLRVDSGSTVTVGTGYTLIFNQVNGSTGNRVVSEYNLDAGAAGSKSIAWTQLGAFPTQLTGLALYFDDPGSIGIGINGDYYLDEDTGDVYHKESGSFVLVANIKGEDGADGVAGSTNLAINRFSGTGLLTTFTLSVTPATENNTQVYISGVYQQKDTYTVSGTTLTFDEAPPLGTNNIEVVIAEIGAVTTPADGSVTTAKIVDGAVTPIKLSNMGFAQCSLMFNSVSRVDLRCFGGNLLTINGVVREIPALGVQLANTTLPAGSTTYYVYAYWTGSAIALEVSTTGWAAYTNGLAYKNGDTSRTLVGMVRKDGSGNFLYTTNTKYVRSYYNDTGIALASTGGSGAVFSAAAFTELDSALQVWGLFWYQEIIEGAVAISASASGTLSAYAGIGINGAGNIAAPAGLTVLWGSQYGQVSGFLSSYHIGTEGLNYFQVLSGVTAANYTPVVGYCGVNIRSRRHLPY